MSVNSLCAFVYVFFTSYYILFIIYLVRLSIMCYRFIIYYLLFIVRYLLLFIYYIALNFFARYPGGPYGAGLPFFIRRLKLRFCHFAASPFYDSCCDHRRDSQNSSVNPAFSGAGLAHGRHRTRFAIMEFRGVAVRAVSLHR